MLQQSTDAATPFPAARPVDNPSDRRAHPRIEPAKLAVTGVRIPHRPSVSLVDLSSGGALLNLPFRIRPESRFPLQLDTVDGRLDVPFQLLRCYVAELKGGVTYYGAGAFDKLLDVQALVQRASGASQRLVVALERLRRGVQRTAAQTRSDAEFDELLGEVLVWLGRGESFELVTLKVKAHLTQLYPSLNILPALRPSRDEATVVACFGLTLTSRRTLSAHDRRYLKSSAQLISMVEGTCRQMREDMGQAPPLPPPAQLVHTTADWIMGQSQATRDGGGTSIPPIVVHRGRKAAVTTADLRATGAAAAFEAMFRPPALAWSR